MLRLTRFVGLALVAAALAVPAALASPLLTENSSFHWQHSQDPQAVPLLTENSDYHWQHSQDPQAAPPLTENSYYNWAHAGDPSPAAIRASASSKVVERAASSGFSFGDAAIGAGALLGAIVMAAGAALLLRPRRRTSAPGVPASPQF
jgi:hypothetical protein